MAGLRFLASGPAHAGRPWGNQIFPEHLYEHMNIHFNNKFPADLHTEFHIIKLLIEKGNLNLIHKKNSYQHYNSMSRKRKLDKLYNEM